MLYFINEYKVTQKYKPINKSPKISYDSIILITHHHTEKTLTIIVYLPNSTIVPQEKACIWSVITLCMTINTESPVQWLV